jgi:hypothetical protein
MTLVADGRSAEATGRNTHSTIVVRPGAVPTDELLLEIPSDERAHCSQKHEGGSSHPNGGFESVIHVHRGRPSNGVAGRDRLRQSRPAVHASAVCGASPPGSTASLGAHSIYEAGR